MLVVVFAGLRLCVRAARWCLARLPHPRLLDRIVAFLDETAPLGLVPYLQAQLLARHLRGDLDAYPPWFWK